MSIYLHNHTWYIAYPRYPLCLKDNEHIWPFIPDIAYPPRYPLCLKYKIMSIFAPYSYTWYCLPALSLNVRRSPCRFASQSLSCCGRVTSVNTATKKKHGHHQNEKIKRKRGDVGRVDTVGYCLIVGHLYIYMYIYSICLYIYIY